MSVSSHIYEGSVVVSLMKGFMVVDRLSRSAKALIAGWRYCVGLGMTFSTTSYVVAT